MGYSEPLTDYTDNVFINCPFDDEYKPLFHAILFAVFDCGFRPRCTKEIANATKIRFESITTIIQNSKYGLHDISRTELDPNFGLPRFNMPLELGLFLGAHRFGDTNQKSKSCLILDKEKYRYQKFLSDIAGQDPDAHDNDLGKVIKTVRDWLATSSGRKTIPGGKEILRRYQMFMSELPELCVELKWDPQELTYNDLTHLMSSWLKKKAS